MGCCQSTADDDHKKNRDLDAGDDAAAAQHDQQLRNDRHASSIGDDAAAPLGAELPPVGQPNDAPLAPSPGHSTAADRLGMSTTHDRPDDVAAWREGAPGATVPKSDHWRSGANPPPPVEVAWPSRYGLLYLPVPTDRFGETQADAFNTRRHLQLEVDGSIDAADLTAPDYKFDLLRYGKELLGTEDLRHSRPQSAHGFRSPAMRASRTDSIASSTGPESKDLLDELDALDLDEVADVAEVGAVETASGPGLPAAGSGAPLYATSWRRMPVGKWRPIAPAIPVMREEPGREYDSDEEFESAAAATDFDDMFRISTATATRRREVDDDGLLPGQVPGSPPRTALATPGFAADDLDIRKKFSAARAKRDFLESAPRWTPARSRDRGSRKGAAGAAGRPPRGPSDVGPASSSASDSGDDAPVGVGDFDEFTSAERRLLLVAAPVLSLELEEARGRHEIHATWAARVYSGYCGVQAVQFFTWHRASLEENLALHATLLLQCCDRLVTLCKMNVAHAEGLALGSLLRSAAVRRLLLRKQYEADRAAAEQRRKALEDSREEEQHLAKRKAARKWLEEKVRLSSSAETSELAAARKTVMSHERTKGLPPVRVALLRSLDGVELHSERGTKSAADGSTVSPLGNPNCAPKALLDLPYRKRKAVEAMDAVLQSEQRARAALESEGRSRFGDMLEAAGRVLPINEDAGKALAYRHAAEVAAASRDHARALALAAAGQVDSERLQLALHEERLRDEVGVKARLLEAEHMECHGIISTAEAAARDVLVDSESASRDVVTAHDQRAETRRMHEAFLKQVEVRRRTATDRLQRVGYATIVRRRLRMVVPRKDEIRAVVGDEHRQSKQLVHKEGIAWADLNQYFQLLTPEPMSELVRLPGESTTRRRLLVPVASPECVPSVEALARGIVERECGEACDVLRRVFAEWEAEASTIPWHLRGSRVTASTRVQALWRGHKMRVHFAAELRDTLIFNRMLRVKARMNVRAHQEIETLRRTEVEDEERSTFGKFFGLAHEDRSRRARERAGAVKIQALFRAYRARRHILPRLRETYWLQRYTQTKKKR
jgi:hypothetical protein